MLACSGRSHGLGRRQDAELVYFAVDVQEDQCFWPFCGEKPVDAP
jgi:hypothetical protein